MRKITWLMGSLAMFGFAGAAAAGGGNCGTSTGADLVIGDMNSISNYTGDGVLEAFMSSLTHCNIGTALMRTEPTTNKHQVVVQNLYRLKTVNGTPRFEQVGMSWAFHAFNSLSGSLCCTSCTPAGSNALGARCSSPDSATIVGSQATLGPRWQINAATGDFPFPPANPVFTGSVARRLAVAIADLDPSLNGGGQFFIEAVGVNIDDALAANALNNASFRPVAISGSGAAWSMTMSGSINPGRSAIHAWADSDAAVVLSSTVVPADGAMIVAGRAYELGDGMWRYEYAVQNLNSHRSGASFSIPVPGSAVISNTGFHDVTYRFGDGIDGVNFDGTDWSVAIGGGQVTWSTQSFKVNPNANALRWGTMYNFRFDANVGPRAANGQATIGLFRPGDLPSIAANTVVPGATSCSADLTGDGVVGSADLGQLLGAWGPNPGHPADFNGDGAVGAADLGILLGGWGPCN